MEWKSYPMYSPPESGNYIASIKKTYADGISFFSDAAFYDSYTNTWWKTDPFADNNVHSEEITNQVVGWISDLGTFLGLRG